jgi:maltose O-acetyltransferase
MRGLHAADLAGELARLLRAISGGRASALRAADLVAGILRARVVLRRANLGRRVYVGGRMTIVADGDVAIDDGVCLFGGMIPSELICHPGASLSIGAGCEFNYGVSIEARRSIRIGARCKVGSMVRIADAFRSDTAPVVLGDDVWLAHGVVVEPGVTIGRGSVVSAGSVVTTSIPPGSLAVGNPARPVRLDVLGGGATRR